MEPERRPRVGHLVGPLLGLAERAFDRVEHAWESAWTRRRTADLLVVLFVGALVAVELRRRGGLPEGLVALNVGRTELSGEALAASLEGARVEDLDVVEAMIREQGARALGQCEALGRLRALKMGGGGLTEDGADAIIRGLGEDVEELSIWRQRAPEFEFLEAGE